MQSTLLTLLTSAGILKARGALVDIGAHRLKLVRATEQLLLLDGFRQQRRTRIDGQLVEQPLGGADRIRALAGDLTRDLESCRPGVVANPRGKSVRQRLLRRENPARIGQLAENIIPHQARQDGCASHVRHQAPFDLHDRHPRIGAKETEVGAERELEAAPERDALDRGDHRHRQLPPAPHRLLRKIRQPMRAPGQVAAFRAWYAMATVVLHRRKTAHVEASAERPAFAGQYYRPQALFLAEAFGRADQRIEHRGIECIHLVRPHQSNIGDAVSDHDRDALLHDNFSTDLTLLCSFTERRGPDLVNRAITDISLVWRFRSSLRRLAATSSRELLNQASPES